MSGAEKCDARGDFTQKYYGIMLRCQSIHLLVMGHLGPNAGDACVCPLWRKAQPFFTSLNPQINPNCQPEKGKTVKCCFPSAAGCLGCVLWRGCLLSMCEITCFLCCSSRGYTRGLLTSARYLCSMAL